MIRRFLICLAAWLTTAGTPLFAADYVFDYNARCQQAYAAYLSLDVPAGDALIRQEFMAHPYNLMATYLSDYGDLLTLLFTGSPEALQQRQGHQDSRLELLERGRDNDPWKDFCRAGIYLHWAAVHGWYGNKFKAATTFRKSYLLLKDNAGRFPRFGQNQIFLGMEEAAAGTIPDEYGWLAGLFGMKGNVRRGAARLQQFLDRNPSAATPLRAEALIYYQYIRFYLLSQQGAVWSFISSDQFPVKGNLLHSFIRANIALNSHHADAALATLQDARDLPGFGNFPSFDYELGNALLMKLDPAALPCYNRFLARSRGNAFIKDAWMRSALCYYLQGNKAKAEDCRAHIGRQGAANTDADKQAQRFFQEGTWPDPAVLQLRLLTEGGYYTQALAELSSVNTGQLRTTDGLEYLYRAGRTYEETGDSKAAISCYIRAIDAGKDRREQFAARACLQLGLLYEKRGQAAEALLYFRHCLTLKHHDFQASIDQQAKAGINRLGG